MSGVADRSKWAEPAVIVGALSVLLLVGGLVWSAATIAAASNNLAANFDQFKRDVTVQISGVQAQIASLPTQTEQLKNLQHDVDNIRSENVSQNAAINAISQKQAVLSSRVDTMQQMIQGMQDAANGKLPGRR